MLGQLKIPLIAGAVLAAGVGAFLWLVDSNAPKRDRYVIPEGYAGWLCVTYAVPGKPSLPKEDGFRLVAFDHTGRVQTSDEGMPGKLKDEFFLSSSSGRRPLDLERELGGGFTMADSPSDPKRYTFTFWVSPDAKKDQPGQGPDSEPRCGPARP